MARRPQIAVIGSARASEDALRLAEQAGEALGRLGTIVSGGRGGIMEAVSRGAKRAGALVVGILPGNTPDDGNPYLDVVLPTGIGLARNMSNVLAGDVVVAIGGAAGTLNEISFAWMLNKPIVALVGAGGWSDRLAGHAIDDRRTDVIVRAESVVELERVVQEILSRT
jgi:hypothetical protein